MLTNNELADCELSTVDWQVLRHSKKFLQPFKEVTKRCEGNSVTLDQVQESMDFIVSHFD